MASLPLARPRSGPSALRRIDLRRGGLRLPFLLGLSLLPVSLLALEERDTCTTNLPYVFRNLRNARTLVVTLEARDRPTKK
jgi:hypothetical protein